MATGKIIYHGYEIIKGPRKHYIYHGDQLIGEAISLNDAKTWIFSRERTLHILKHHTTRDLPPHPPAAK